MLTAAKLFSAPSISVKKSDKPQPKLFSQFIRGVKKNEVQDVLVQPNNRVVYYMDENDELSISNYVPSEAFWNTLIESDANVNLDLAASNTSLSDVTSIGFTLLLGFVLLRMLLSGVGGGGINPFNMGEKPTEVENEITTRFDDVQGIDSAKDELQEIVDFLREPERFIGTGAKIPRGALLTGKPGTGKTLLARAIAGESSVPFIQCSGSSFVEMFVGVGAKRVRDVFEMARENQPCIVFIDEIDAIGKKRSMNGFAANDEREQTINQLLTEMDGFDNDSQIVVIAATNRVDILDDALLRPGRFDRKIQVGLPDVYGREKILQVHSKNKNLSPEVSLMDVARQTTGFSGADLENLMNECAIRSVKEGTNVITPPIIEDVYQRIVVGAKGGAPMSDERKKRVAYHEAGHAIIGVLMPSYDEVRKVSIIPRGDAGGVTFFQPSSDERGMYGKDSVTTGASSDFAQVHAIAREMVTTYGMSEAVGKINVDVSALSQQTAYLVDLEVHRITDECYSEVLDILSSRKTDLVALKDILIRDEIIDGKVVYDMIKM